MIDRVRAGSPAIPWVVAIVALIAYGMVDKSPLWLNVGVLGLIIATAASAWNLLAGYAGQFSFGPAIFFALGAYSVPLAEDNLASNAWVGIALGVVASALVALVVGFPVFRLRGHHFIIATIALQLMCFIAATNTQSLGGATGLAVPIQGTSLEHLQFRPDDAAGYYWVALVIYLLTAASIALFLHTRGGYYVRAIRDDEGAARGLGVRARRWKMIVFVLSSSVTSVAGSLYASYALFVDPNVVAVLLQSVLIALPALIGGLGTFWGPLLGAFLLQVMSQQTRVQFSGSGLAIDLALFGLLIMAFTVFWPGGIVGLFRRLVPRTA